MIWAASCELSVLALPINPLNILGDAAVGSKSLCSSLEALEPDCGPGAHSQISRDTHTRNYIEPNLADANERCSEPGWAKLVNDSTDLCAIPASRSSHVPEISQMLTPVPPCLALRTI